MRIKGFKIHPVYVVIIILFLSFVMTLFYIASLKEGFKSKLEDLHGKGMYLTGNELNALNEIPFTADNAADVYNIAFSLMTDFNDPNNDLPFENRLSKDILLGQPFSENVTALMVENVNNNTDAIEYIYRASGIEHCRFDVDYNQGINTTVPHLGSLRKASSLLIVDGFLKLQQGQKPEFLRAISANNKISNILLKEPTLVSRLVGIAIYEINTIALELAMNISDFNDDHLKRIYIGYEEAEELLKTKNYIFGESSYTTSFLKLPLSSFSDYIYSLASVGSRDFNMLFKKATGLIYSDAIGYLKLVEDFFPILDLPYHERLEELRRFQDTNKNVLERNVVVRLSFFSWDRVFLLDNKASLKLRAARIAIAVERFRLAQGRLPDELSELVGQYIDEVPLDPFDGKQIRYRKLKKGFEVYGVGEDLVDSLASEPNDIDQAFDDITFRVLK